jgi:hypothetical protein
MACQYPLEMGDSLFNDFRFNDERFDDLGLLISIVRSF